MKTVVYLTTTGSSVRRRGELLQVFKGTEKLADVRLFNLERLVVVGAVQISTQALGFLLDRGIDVVYLTSHGRMRGTLVSGASRNVFLRLAQIDCWRNQAFRLAFSAEVTRAKVTAQEKMLVRFERNHPGSIEPVAVERIQACLRQVGGATTVDQLRGIEGMGAALYYRQFGRMLGDISFPGRKMRPSTDPVNALLSLGYVMLTNEVGAALEARGFDPAVSFLHGLRYGRKSLSLDLVEPFRQPVIDRLTLRLFNRRQLVAEDFEGGEKGLRLGKEALRRYFLKYEEQMASPSEGVDSPSWRQQLMLQAQALQKMVMAAEAGPLFTWKG